MVDFWFTLGAMVIDPVLLTDIAAKAPTFQHIAEYILELPTSTPTVLAPKAAGYLDANPDPQLNTTAVFRGVIRDRLVTPGAGGVKFGAHPPISLYTAAKFIQLVAVYGGSLATAVNQASAVFYKYTTKPLTAFSLHFPTLLGSAFVDDLLPQFLVGKVGSPDMRVEFGTTTAENALVKSWVTDVGFNDPTTGAQAMLLQAPSWDVVCKERMIPYGNSIRAAN